MGFYVTKPAFRNALRPLARHTTAIHQDVWTWAAVVVCLAAGALLAASRHYPTGLLVVPILLFLRLLLNVFDGVVAQETGQAGARGEALSEFTDRVADLAVLGGVAVSGLARPWLAVLAIIATLLVSYVGILGKAVGAGRQYGGLMGKPDRMVVVMVASVAQFIAWQATGATAGVGDLAVEIFDWGSLVIIALGTHAILVRLRTIFQSVE